MKENRISSLLSGLFLGIMVLLFLTAFGLGIIHITDFPYTIDIKALNISENTGLPREEILANYNTVMDFLSPFSSSDFDLPSLKYSEQGASHFYDCKPIFNAVYFLGAMSGLFLLLLAFLKRKKVSAYHLKTSGAVTLAIPALFCAFLLVDFDRAFVLFHKIFFNGDTWLFDPITDEIINILPAEFFMHCALFIALIWVAGSITQFMLARKKQTNI